MYTIIQYHISILYTCMRRVILYMYPPFNMGNVVFIACIFSKAYNSWRRMQSAEKTQKNRKKRKKRNHYKFCAMTVPVSFWQRVYLIPFLDLMEHI